MRFCEMTLYNDLICKKEIGEETDSSKIESLKLDLEKAKEELGWENLEYKFLGVSEELVNDKGYNNHQIKFRH